MSSELKKEISKSSLGAGLILIGTCCGGLVIWLASIAGGGGIFALLAGFLAKNLFFISIGIILISLAVYFLVSRKG